jgi:hypothetical protein
MTITTNGAIARSRAYHATVALRVARRLAQQACVDACDAYDKAYCGILQAELAKLEADDDA